jgi:hypothetical protein
MAMNLSDLTDEVRDLIGYGAYDRLFSQEMTTDAINFACDEVAELMGITRVDVMLPVSNNKATLPTDVNRVVGVQIGTVATSPAGAFTAVWDVPAEEGFLNLPLLWEVDVLPLGGPTPVTYAWTMTPSASGSVSFSPTNGQVVSISSVSLSVGEYLDVTCVVTVPGQVAQTLSQVVQYVEA